MSHFTKITAEIKDLEALTFAAKKMGFNVQANGMCRYYYGAERKEFVIKLPGQYDVALNKAGDHYDIEADFFQNHVSRYIGQDGNLLMQKYAVEKARIEAFKNGLGVTEKNENGLTTLTLIDPDTGGEIQIDCYPGGKTEVKTSGFQGQGCMKFKNIEESLGEIEKVSHTDEFYLPEPETAVEVVRMDY